MNFSLVKTEVFLLDFELPDTDIFCFFTSAHSVNLPSHLWPTAVAASLKLKRNILILERARSIALALDVKQRWNVGEDYLWMAPRSKSVFFEAVHRFSGSYPDIKSSLLRSK